MHADRTLRLLLSASFALVIATVAFAGEASASDVKFTVIEYRLLQAPDIYKTIGEVRVPVIQAADPLYCVVRGSGSVLESIDLLRQVTELA